MFINVVLFSVIFQAKSFLGEMRVRCNAIKQELESNIQSYKDSIKNSRSVEKQIQVRADRHLPSDYNYGQFCSPLQTFVLVGRFSGLTESDYLN